MKKILLFFVFLIAISSVAAAPLSDVTASGGVVGNPDPVKTHDYTYMVTEIGGSNDNAMVEAVFQFDKQLSKVVGAGFVCEKKKCFDTNNQMPVTEWKTGCKYKIGTGEWKDVSDEEKDKETDWFGFDVDLPSITIPPGEFRIACPAKTTISGLAYFVTGTGEHGYPKYTKEGENEGDVNANPQEPPSQIPEFSTFGIITALIIILGLLAWIVYKKNK